MNGGMIRILIACVLLLFLAGCWDRTEINDYAFWMGTALDKSKDNKFRVSAQIAIPHGISAEPKQGGADRSNVVITAEGNTLLSSCELIQSRLPRRIFTGHRRAVFISERLARDGLGDILDMYARNPEFSLRFGLFVVLGIQPEEVLKLQSPFNPFSSDALVRQDKFAMIGDIAPRDLFVNFSSQATCPVLSVITTDELTKEEQKNVVEMNQLAVFNKKLKMVGLLKEEEAMVALWMINRLKLSYLTAYIPSGKGYITVHETNLKSTITLEMRDGKPRISVLLSGAGTVWENNTTLDLSDSSKLSIVESELNQYVKKLAEKTVRKVQHDYRTDIFGFGEKIHQEHAKEWRLLRSDWEKHFHGLDVTVKVETKLKRIGVRGPRPHQEHILF